MADDTGRGVTGSGIPPNAFVGAVTDTGPQFPTVNTGSATVGSFQLVTQDGSPLDPSGPVNGVTLSAEGAPGFLSPGQTADPLYDALDPTPGGGVTGSVLISPLIRPGTVSSVDYNHYSWLRTMEDVFNVSAGRTTLYPAPGPCPAGSTARVIWATPPSRVCGHSGRTSSPIRGGTGDRPPAGRARPRRLPRPVASSVAHHGGGAGLPRRRRGGPLVVARTGGTSWPPRPPPALWRP